MVVKSVPHGFMRHMQKMAQPLLKEVVWYSYILPMFAKQFPAVFKIFSPECYHAYVEGMERVNGGLWQRLCCALCYVPCRGLEKGIIVMEDLTLAKPKPFYMLDKTKVPGLEHTKLIMEAIGNYHGAWWQLLKKPEGSFDGFLSKADVLKFYGSTHPKLFIKSFLLKQIKLIARLLESRKADPKLIARLKKYNVTRAVNSMYTSRTSRIASVTHGDLWINNMMFRDDAEVSSNTSN